MTTEPIHLPHKAIQALKKGNKIQAIKWVRTEKSMCLKEAREQVENFLRQHPDLKKKYKSRAEGPKGLYILMSLMALAALIVVVAVSR